MPKGLITIGEKAFYNSLLTSILIPANVETIEAAAFKGCTNLTSVTFGRNSNLKIIKGGYDTHYEHINYGAFTDCTALKSIEIPASVEIIGVSAFFNCIYNHRTTKTNQKYPSVNL